MSDPRKSEATASQSPVVKVVINQCYGGFGLSHDAIMALAERKGITLYPWADEISTRIYGEPGDFSRICLSWFSGGSWWGSRAMSERA